MMLELFADSYFVVSCGASLPDPVCIVEDQPRFQSGGGKDLLLVVEEPWAARDVVCVWAGAQSAVGGTR